MATPPISENPEVEQHYLAQFAIVAALSSAARDLWPHLDPEDIDGTFPTIRRGLAALVEHFSRASISVAADHYDTLRSEHVSGRFNTPIIDPASSVMVGRVLDGIAADASALARTAPDPLYLASATTQAHRAAETVAQSFVADSASNEIFHALGSDREARGWARITRPGACYFCRMLASRGAVYLTERSGSFRAHVPKNGRGGVCTCTVEPQFSRDYEPTAQARADLETWQRVTKGFSNADAIDEFRRAVEGRMDGPRRRRRRKGDPKPSKPTVVNGQRLGFEQLTPAQLTHQLGIVESLPDSDYRTQQIERVRGRLADLGA